MMRNHGLFAFVLTTVVLVPAAAHYLTAGHAQVVAFAPPTSTTLELGDAKVEVKLEHPLVDPGESLKIKLTAAGAKANKRLAVGLVIYGASGNEGARVPGPPVAVAHETVSIPIGKEGVGSKEITIPLRGAKMTPWSPSAFFSYEVLVMAPDAADRLAALRSGTRLIGNEEMGIPDYNKTGRNFMRVYAGWGEPEGRDKKLFGEGAIARVTAHTRSINKLVALQTPATATVDKMFTVAVVVKNPTQKRLDGLELDLQDLAGIDASSKIDISADILPSSSKFQLAPNESRRFEFRVTPNSTGILGLYARVSCSGDGCKADALTRTGGTFDAVEIKKAETNTIVGSK